MYIFTYWFCLPLKDAAGFLLSLAVTSNLISNPEYTNTTHNLVTNFNASVDVLPPKAAALLQYCHTQDLNIFKKNYSTL